MRSFVLLAVLVSGFALTSVFLNPGPSLLEIPVIEQSEPLMPEDLKQIPKKDRPDLAAELDALLTIDPATGIVPRERLWAASRRATTLKRSRSQELVTSEWEERGPSNVGGRTRAIAFDPNDPKNKRVWVGGVAGGLWYTDDITDPLAPWANVNDFWSNLAISSLAFDPSTPSVAYAGTGEGWFNGDAVRGAGIFKTIDGGENWDLIESTADNSQFYYVQDLAVHPATSDVLAATRSGLFRSQDGGESWERVLGQGVGASTSRIADLEIAADGTIYAALGIFSGGEIYSSSSGALGSWTELSLGTNGLPSSGYDRVEIATAPSDADVVYAALQDEVSYGVLGIYRTEDAGTTWEEVNLPNDVQYGTEFARGQAWYDLALGVDPNDADGAYVGAINLFKTTDGGDSWTQVSHWYGGFGEPYVHADQHAVVFRPGSSEEVVFGNDGGVYYTATATLNQPVFLNRNDGYNVTQFYAGSIAPEADSPVMLAGAQDNGTQRYNADGINVTTEVYGGDGGFNFIDQDDSNVAITSYVYNNFYRSLNGGNNFTATLINETSGFFINRADYDDRENILYTARDGDSIYRVSNVDRVIFTREIVNVDIARTATHLRVSPYAPEGTSTLFLGTLGGLNGGRVYRLDDAESAEPTLTWINEGAGMPAGSVSCIEIGADEDHLLVTYSNYGLTSVWETRDGGETWVSKGGDLPDVPVRWALFNPNDRRAALLATEAGVFETTTLGADEPVWTPSPSIPTTRVDMLQWRASDQRVMAATHGRGSFTATFKQNPVSTEDPAATLATTHTLSAFPNPFAERTAVVLRVAAPQRVRAEVFDVAGRRVAVLHDGPLAPGAEHRFTLDGRGLASGTYVVAVTGEAFRDDVRLTLTR